MEKFAKSKVSKIPNGSQQWEICNFAKVFKGSEWSNITVNSQFFRES